MSDATTCPYCRMSFDQEGLVKIYCPGCGMPHHEDCYQENGGCTVFGCPRAPADDPKLQVSHAELSAAVPVTSQYVAAQPAVYAQPTIRKRDGCSACCFGPASPQEPYCVHCAGNFSGGIWRPQFLRRLQRQSCGTVVSHGLEFLLSRGGIMDLGGD